MLNSTYKILLRRKNSYEKTLREHYLRGDKREKKESWAKLIRFKAKEIGCFIKNCRIIEELDIGGDFVTVGSLCRMEDLDNGEIINLAVLGCADIRFNYKHRKEFSYQSREGLELLGKFPGSKVEIRGKKYIIREISKYQE